MFGSRKVGRGAVPVVVAWMFLSLLLVGSLSSPATAADFDADAEALTGIDSESAVGICRAVSRYLFEVEFRGAQHDEPLRTLDRLSREIDFVEAKMKELKASPEAVPMFRMEHASRRKEIVSEAESAAGLLKELKLSWAPWFAAGSNIKFKCEETSGSKIVMTYPFEARPVLVAVQYLKHGKRYVVTAVSVSGLFEMLANKLNRK